MNMITIPASRPPRDPLITSILQMDPITIVAGEGLVSTIPGQSNFHMLPCQTGNEIGRQHGRVAERLLQVPGQHRHGFDEIRLHDQLMVVRTEPLCYKPCVGRFIEIRLAESDRKSLDRPRARSCHQSNHGGGVRPATQHRSQRHIRDQADAHRFGQTVFQFFQPFFFAGGIMRAVLRQIPILANAYLPFLEFQQMSRRQLLNRLETPLLDPECSRNTYIAAALVD